LLSRSIALATCAFTELRRKVEIDPAHPDPTVRGVGYVFVLPKD
jgi:hypothetical protein